MIKANFISAKGAWHARAADSILLGFAERQSRHAKLKTTNGLEFELDLPGDVMLRNGDALVLEDGRLVEVVAAPEPLAEVRLTEPRDLARIAYVLGSRHLPMQLMPNKIRMRENVEVETLARALGGKVMHIEAPFDPEGVAYAGPDIDEGHVHGPGCGHDHHDHHGHDHHDHAHHDHGHKHDHHDHDHGHKHDHHAHDHHDDHGHKHDHSHDHGHHQGHGHKH